MYETVTLWSMEGLAVGQSMFQHPGKLQLAAVYSVQSCPSTARSKWLFTRSIVYTQHTQQQVLTSVRTRSILIGDW